MTRPRLLVPVAAALLMALAAPALARPMEIVVTGLSYPEGPLLAPGGGILIADMELNQIIWWRDDGARTAFDTGDCGPTAITQIWDPESGNGALSIACHMRHEVRRASVFMAERATGESVLEFFFPPIGPVAEVNRPNDMTGNEAGAIYVTSSGEFDPALIGQGSVWLINPASRGAVARRVAEGFNYANGIALSPDGKSLLVSEHFTGKIWRFAIAADGDLYARELFAELPLAEGASWLTGADGIEFIGDGAVAIAQYGAGRVFIFGPDGSVLAMHETPGFPLVTNLVMDPASQTLYATTSRPVPVAQGGGHEGVLMAIAQPLRP